MNNQLNDVMTGQENNYILPFLWQHGNHRDKLKAQIQSVYDSGARAFCVESRPHDDFCKENWWADMEVIFSIAENLQMKVWILDDKHFPTGYANGLIAEKYPHLRKWLLREEHIDVMGSMSQATLLLNPSNDELLGVYAYARTGIDEELEGKPIDLSNNVHDNWLCFDVPDGCYRVFFIYKTRKGSLHGQENYIDMLNKDSVHVLIEAVYEPHYHHFAKRFGNVFAGFFSDEPNLGNTFIGAWTADYGMYNRTVGMPGLALPWSDSIPEMMGKMIDNHDILSTLPALWYPVKGVTPQIRLEYMNAVTILYRDCFCVQLGDWCRDHGVQYIGHVIEDMNTHSRLGHGTGHYFRALAGQDMSGIDVVLHQVMPGFAHYKTAASSWGGVVNPAFFQYVLGKLGASLAHTNSQMKGRAMCEIFGAYGWAEGSPMMKWLIDFLLIRGINHFIPHAFSPKYPNHDCPPHFYAEGNDPQFTGFSALMRYTNKVSHLLQGGCHQADVAILYHAEAEWMNGDCMLVESPAQELYDAHIDYDILPIDVICNQAKIYNGKLAVEDECYNCLIIPYAQNFPDKLLEAITRLSNEGGTIIFIDAFPKNTNPPANIVKLSNLVAELKNKDLPLIKVDKFPLLRVYHSIHRNNKHINNDGDSATIMLFNESITNSVDTTIHVPYNGTCLHLDLLNGQSYKEDVLTGEIAIKLSPYQSELLFFGKQTQEIDSAFSKKTEWDSYKEIENKWDISLCQTGLENEFTPYAKKSPLLNITSPKNLPNFSGVIQYKASFKLQEIQPLMLDLGNVGQTSQLFINRKEAGIRICPPYSYDISKLVVEGENEITVEVANTLVHRNPDYFSHFIQIPPSGLIGPVQLLKKILANNKI